MDEYSEEEDEEDDIDRPAARDRIPDEINLENMVRQLFKKKS